MAVHIVPIGLERVNYMQRSLLVTLTVTHLVNNSTLFVETEC